MSRLFWIIVFFYFQAATAQNLAWSPVLGTGQIWKVSISGVSDFQLTIGNKNQRGFMAQVLSNNKNSTAELFYRQKEDTLELTILPYACTFSTAKSVQGLSFIGAAYYLAPNATSYQNLQRRCEMSYLDPSLRGAPVPALGGAPIPALGGAPVPALGGAPISSETLKRLIGNSVPTSAAAPLDGALARAWQPTFTLGQTWDIAFEGVGTWAVNLFALEQNLPYGYAVGADTRVGLGIYVTPEQSGIGTDLAIFVVAGQKDLYYCIVLPQNSRNRTWTGIGAVQPSGKELLATGKGCQISLRPTTLASLFEIIRL